MASVRALLYTIAVASPRVASLAINPRQQEIQTWNQPLSQVAPETEVPQSYVEAPNTIINTDIPQSYSEPPNTIVQTEVFPTIIDTESELPNTVVETGFPAHTLLPAISIINTEIPQSYSEPPNTIVQTDFTLHALLPANTIVETEVFPTAIETQPAVVTIDPIAKRDGGDEFYNELCGDVMACSVGQTAIPETWAPPSTFETQIAQTAAVTDIVATSAVETGVLSVTSDSSDGLLCKFVSLWGGSCPGVSQTVATTEILTDPATNDMPTATFIWTDEIVTAVATDDIPTGAVTDVIPTSIFVNTE